MSISLNYINYGQIALQYVVYTILDLRDIDFCKYEIFIFVVVNTSNLVNNWRGSVHGERHRVTDLCSHRTTKVYLVDGTYCDVVITI